MDWTTWIPEQKATLGFIRQNDQVLLIHKKRGLGAGKINGFGGKLEPGETPIECITREGQEELHIEIIDPEPRGELHFQFTDGFSLFCTVFSATKFTGVPTETEEAIPLWFPVDQLPFDAMWEDDRLWLPRALKGDCFKGYFHFDGDKMLTQLMEWEK